MRVLAFPFKEWLFLVSLLFPIVVLAQNEETPSIDVLYTNSPITLDGALDEAIWQRTVPGTNFWQWFPTDTIRAQHQTEVYMAYDDQNLYVAIKCYAEGGDFATASLKRDYRASDGSDNITLVFDPFRDQTNAFVFGINPYGVQREALISGGGRQREDFNTSWDNRWFSAAQTYEEYWTGEFIIPFTTLRYRKGEKVWYFNSYRFDTQTNERSTWIKIPRNQMVMARAFNGEMIFEKPLSKPGSNISLIPYVLGGSTQDFEAGETKPNIARNIGGDMKIAVTPSLNLDLTVNPDFSQVEVDRQVTNLDRFEIFFPEKRQFFLENSDLFATLGTEGMRPFFSRRIGVARDTLTGQNLQNPIYFGARLSGKLNDRWRIGLLNMQTAPVEESGIPALNYSVATIQRQMFKRSFFSAFLVNRQGVRDSLGNYSIRPEEYNRVFGLDYNLASQDNAWNGKVFFHHSFSENQEKNAFVQGTNLSYTQLNYQLTWDQQWVGSGYEATSGFVPRTGFIRFAPGAQWYFYPKKARGITYHGPGLITEAIYDESFRKTDHQLGMEYNIWFANTARLNAMLTNNYTYLFSEFDPSRSDLTPFPEGSDYNYTQLEVDFNSDRRKLFSFNANAVLGQYFGGNRYSATCSLTYRIQPYGSISAEVNANQITLPQVNNPNDTTVNLFLVGPRFDITFSKKLFFTAFLQYNSQLDNLNINARLQWRYQPVSDFFLVYTDNYMPNKSGLMVRNRAIVAKLTYWLNI